MAEILAFDPKRRTSAQAIADLAALGYLNEDQYILDATYGTGRFWRPPPRGWMPGAGLLVTNDLDRNTYAAFHRNYRNLPDDWKGRYDVVVFDPPFKLNGTGGSHPSDEAYGVAGAYDSGRVDGIWAGFHECLRVTRPGGLVVFKIQDQVCSGNRNWLSKKAFQFARAFVEHPARLVDELYIVGYRKQPKDRECRRCGGTGNELLAMYRRCGDCGGVGRVPIKQKHARSNVSVLQVYRKAK